MTAYIAQTTVPLVRVAQATAAADAAAVDVPPGLIDSQSVLAYCTSRLNSLDGMIQQRFAEQQKRNDAITEAGKLVGILGQWNGVTDKIGSYGEAHTAMAQQLLDLSKTVKDPDVQAKIQEAYKLVTGNPMPQDGSGVVLNREAVTGMSAEQWQAEVGTVKSLQDTLTKDNELSMLSLQSIVSQRQLAVQLTTQMMQTMHDGAKQILGNIR